MGFVRRRSGRFAEATVDRLTGAYDRRQFDRDLAAGIAVTELPTASLLVEIDRAAGGADACELVADEVLERVSWVIMATVRTTDIVYRPGHATFCVLLPMTSDDQAVTAADRIRVNVERLPQLAADDVTVSIGVAGGASDDVAGTVERAGRALDGERGANRVVRVDGATGDVAAPTSR